MKYRSDIDGLRSLAILPVLIFHAGREVLHGGYVGVDVFFVISGYLITKIIADEIFQERFSIVNFYERRLRRIFPCLFAVLLFSCVGAALLFLPNDFNNFSKSLLATILFASNILFYRQSGYFDGPAEMKPLLHTWSLAVEEQFYIFFPIILIFAYRYARNWISAILIPIAVLSFAASVWGVAHKPAFTFFMAPTRVWELFVGSFLALGVVQATSNKILREVLAGLGVALICWAVFTFTPKTTFPGANALFPVMGAALLIYAAQGTITGRILSVRPVVFIGKISYSLYLWHWPIIVFLEYYLLEKLSGITSLAAIIASLIIAALSWRYIEQPFREKNVFSSRQVFTWSAVGMGLLFIFGISGIIANGLPYRFPQEVVRLAGFADDYSPRRAECHRDEKKNIPFDKSCVYGAKVTPQYALWGDSHAVEMSYALGELAEKHNKSIIQISSSFCPPALGVKIKERPECREYNYKALAYLLGNSQIKTVFLIARYDSDIYRNTESLTDGLRKSIEELGNAGKQVVLVYPVPTAPVNVPEILARRMLKGYLPDSIATDKGKYLKNTKYALDFLDSLSLPYIFRVRLQDRLCNKATCSVYEDGSPLYFDDNHLNIFGARYVLPLFEPYF